MSELIPDYDPLQEQIYAALSIAGRTAACIEASIPHVPENCRNLMMRLVQRLHQESFFEQKTKNDLQVVIEHIEQSIDRGARHEIIVDECYVKGAYSQTVYTPEAEVLRDSFPALQQMHARLAAIHNINTAENLALEMRSGH